MKLLVITWGVLACLGLAVASVLACGQVAPPTCVHVVDETVGAASPVPADVDSCARVQVVHEYPQTGSLVVRARWSDGTKAAGLTLSLRLERPLCGVSAWCRDCDGSGELFVTGLEPGDIAVVGRQGKVVRCKIVAGVTSEVEYRVLEGETIHGRLVDASGRNVEGAVIQLRRYVCAESGPNCRWDKVCVTGRRGEFVLRDVVVPLTVRAVTRCGRLSGSVEVQGQDGELSLSLETR